MTMDPQSIRLSGIADTIDSAELEAFHTQHPLKRDDRARLWRIGLVVEVAAILALWEYLVVVLQVVRPAFLPPPSAILASFVELVTASSFVTHLQFSLTNLVIGVFLASAIGILVGLIVGWSPRLDALVSPLIWTVYAIPKVALAPLIILGLGLGPPSKILLVFLLGVFPVALNTIDGVQTVEPSLVRAGRVFGSRGARLISKIVLPSTLPYIMVGLRRAVAIGFIGEILGEFLGGAYGIGHLLLEATVEFRMDDALAIVVIMVIVANLGLSGLDAVRRRFAPWYEVGPNKDWRR